MISPEFAHRKEHVQPSKFHGVIVPTVTPLTEDGQLDTEGIVKLTEDLIIRGVQGLFPLGTTGESDSIGLNLKIEVIKTFADAARHRIPVLAGISQPTLEETIHLASQAENLAVDALVIKPLYLNGDPVRNLLDIFQRFPYTPIMLYNIPGSHNKEWLSKNTPLEVIQAVSDKPNFIGVKDSSNDIEYSLRLIRFINDAREKAGVWQGFPNLGLESLKAGAVGLVQSLANIEPELFVNLYMAVRDEDIELADSKQQAINQLFVQIPFNPQHVPSIKSLLVEKEIIASDRMFTNAA